MQFLAQCYQQLQHQMLQVQLLHQGHLLLQCQLHLDADLIQRHMCCILVRLVGVIFCFVFWWITQSKITFFNFPKWGHCSNQLLLAILLFTGFWPMQGMKYALTAALMDKSRSGSEVWVSFGDEGYVRQCHLLLLGLIDEFLFPDPHYFALLLLSFLFNFIKTLVCPWLLMTAKGQAIVRNIRGILSLAGSQRRQKGARAGKAPSPKLSTVKGTVLDRL